MRTLQEKYNALLEGNFSEAQFVRDARLAQPNLITQYNGFNDTVQILKNKGMIAEVTKKEEPKYSTAKPEDLIAPDVLDTGIKFELDKKFGTLDVSDEDYNKAKETAIKNLSKDVLYYVKQDSIQLETPKEKMEKVKLNEEVDSKAIVSKMVPIIQDYLAAGGSRGAARDIMDDLKNGRNLHVYADIKSVEDLQDQLDYEYSYSDDLSDLDEKGPVYPEDKHTMTPDELGYDVDEVKALKEAIKKIIAKIITE